ncbi:MAG: hypothetical protein KAS99_03830 [Candidatus Omnitrophica bacterium]|nr:hypothetical protein [Candidatus Omnitrophota bacterium]
MEKQGLRNSYIVTLAKLFIFLIIFCFLPGITTNFFGDLRQSPGFKSFILYFSILTPFLFYTFVADLNEVYGRVQDFFFRHSFFSLIVPSILIVLALGYFIIPKILGSSFNKDIFLFLGGVISTVHLIFIARRLKASTFSGFVHYLFIFSLLYTVSLFLFAIYLKVGFKLGLLKILSDSLRSGASLIESILTQIVGRG